MKSFLFKKSFLFICVFLTHKCQRSDVWYEYHLTCYYFVGSFVIVTCVLSLTVWKINEKPFIIIIKLTKLVKHDLSSTVQYSLYIQYSLVSALCSHPAALHHVLTLRFAF